jgi:hypothetical protein
MSNRAVVMRSERDSLASHRMSSVEDEDEEEPRPRRFHTTWPDSEKGIHLVVATSARESRYVLSQTRIGLTSKERDLLLSVAQTQGQPQGGWLLATNRMAKVLAAVVIFLAAAPLAGAWSSSGHCTAPGRQECSMAQSQTGQQRPGRCASSSPSALLASIGRNEQQETQEDGVDPNFLKEELGRYLEKRREIGADKIAQQYVRGSR